MGENDELLRALEAGVAAEPGNVSLRLHLGSMLIDSGRASEGLDHCEWCCGATRATTGPSSLRPAPAGSSASRSNLFA